MCSFFLHAAAHPCFEPAHMNQHTHSPKTHTHHDETTIKCETATTTPQSAAAKAHAMVRIMHRYRTESLRQSPHHGSHTTTTCNVQRINKGETIRLWCAQCSFSVPGAGAVWEWQLNIAYGQHISVSQTMRKHLGLETQTRVCVLYELNCAPAAHAH